MSEDYRLAMAALKTGNAPERVEQDVLVAFRRRRQSQRSSRAVRRWSWGAAVAASVALAAVGLYRVQHPNIIVEPAPLIAHITAPPPVAFVPAPVAFVAASRPKPAVRRSPRVPKRQEEVATPYFALPGAESLPFPDAEAVVRMVVPRSTLQLVGFPVNEVPRPDFIRADVVVGQDGMARAIRFVQ